MNTRRWRTLYAGAMCACAITAGAQVLMQPTEPPSLTAAQSEWYLTGEPIVFDGSAYYRGGPQVFFDGNVMVRAGSYDGVPVYVNTTLEPRSVVFVPVGGRTMQPYERRREGDLAGTTGSRAPSFPVTPAGATTLEIGNRRVVAQGPPFGPETPRRVRFDAPEHGLEHGAAVPVGTARTAAGAARRDEDAVEYPRGPVRSARPPEATLGVWVAYRGERWQACGEAQPENASRFETWGEYRGYPVYAERSDQGHRRIYLPSTPGFLAPYWRGAVGRDATGNCVPEPAAVRG